MCLGVTAVEFDDHSFKVFVNHVTGWQNLNLPWMETEYSCEANLIVQFFGFVMVQLVGFVP